MHNTYKISNKPWFWSGLIVLIFAGAVMINFWGAEIRNEAVTELTHNIEIVSSVLCPSTLNKLSFTSADAANTDYKEMRDIFVDLGASMKKEYGIRGIYAMRKVGDEIRLIVDSAPEGDPWHSEPGTVYKDPPQILLDVIRDNQRRFGGPHVDRHGTFYSAFDADVDDGVVIAYAGLDIEPAAYDKLTRGWSVMPTAVVVALLALYVICCLFIERRKRMGGEAAARIEENNRRAVEAAKARLSQEREKLLMNLNEGVISFDPAGKVVFANRAALDSVCRGSAECAREDHDRRWVLVDQGGRPLPADRQPSVAGFPASLDKEPDGALRGFMKRFDGEVFPVILTAVELEFMHGIKNNVITFRDVTREAEQDRAKNDFISMAAHQLKTPLTALKWAVELLADAKHKWTSDEAASVEQVGAAARQLNDLVTSLLSIGRLESGRLNLELQPSDLVALADAAVKDVAYLSKNKRHKVTVLAGAGLPLVNLDRRLISEVYKNLLTNAIKYTPAGGEIDVQVAVDGGHIIVSVKDNGFGIPADEMAQIYKRFYRASNVTNLPEEGTGLGLSVVKQIMDISGGRTWFESTEGIGSIFYFSLPLSGTPPRTVETGVGRG